MSALDKARYISEVDAASIKAIQKVINGGNVSAAFYSLAKTMANDKARPLDYTVAAVQAVNAIVQVVLTNDNIKKYFGASSALLGLGKDAKNMFDEYDQHDTVGSDTAASLIANFTGLIAQVMKVVPPIAAPKFLVQLA